MADANPIERNSGALALSGGMRWGFWACTVVAIAVVLRRVFALAYPPSSGPPQLLALDAFFAAHAALTLAHILSALAFVVSCAAMIFRTPGNALWLERLFFPLGCSVGITAFAMSTEPVGGWSERSAVLLFDSLFLFSLLRAYQYWKNGNLLLERRWMLRAIAILLGIATTRPVMGIFFATARLTHLTPSQFFGFAFWIGFSINTVGIELWLRSQDRARNPLPRQTLPLTQDHT